MFMDQGKPERINGEAAGDGVEIERIGFWCRAGKETKEEE